MAAIRWKDTYNVGISIIDEQHKALIAIVNELYEAQQLGTTQSIISNVLDKLNDYSLYHFNMEEGMQLNCHYAQLEEHKKEHAFFIDKIKNLKTDLAKNNLLLSLKTLDFLKDWTIQHILGSDKEFADYLRVSEGG